MKQITMSKRQMRMLRDNLTGNQEGYDYTDLCRLDFIAKKLTEAQGEYAEQLAEYDREGKAVRKRVLRGELKDDAVQRLMNKATLAIEDLHEQAETEQADLLVEDGDYKLIKDKIASAKWLGADDTRSLIIGMVSAIHEAATVEVVKKKAVDADEVGKEQDAGKNIKDIIKEMKPEYTPAECSTILNRAARRAQAKK